MHLLGLIGFPLSHSFSKNYFTQKFEQEGIGGWRYELFPIPTIDDLLELLDDKPDLVGLNVTIPYKQAVIPFLHDTSHLPASLQACNCIRIRNGKLEGFNTDYIGFEKSLLPLLKPGHSKALVLGNGGASKAVMYVLQKLNIAYEVVSRQLHEGSTLTYKQLSPEIIASHTLIVNTTPLGTFPNVDECAPIDYNVIGSQHLLFDLVYNPEMTMFMRKGASRGAVVKNGFDMLVGQAETAWKIWNE